MDAQEKIKKWEDETQLIGTPKQIAWATKLRHTAFENLAADMKSTDSEVWRFAAEFLTRTLRTQAKAEKPDDVFFVKMWNNLLQMYPSLAPQPEAVYTRKEMETTAFQLYKDIVATIIKFKESSTWINARERSYGAYLGLPIRLAILNILAKGEPIPEKVFEVSWLNLMSEQLAN